MANEIEAPITTPRVVAAESPVVVTPQTMTAVEPATHNYQAVQIIWFVIGLITTLCALRFVLKLLGASTQSGFVTLIYGVTDGLVAPFRAIFPTAAAQTSTVDIASLVAIVIYVLVGWGLVSLAKLMTAPRGARSVS